MKKIKASGAKPVETALRESEERFRSVFDKSPVALSLATLPEGRLMEVNPAVLANFGYRREELIGKTTSELNFWVNPADRDRLLGRLAEQGALDGVELAMRKKNGEEIIILASVNLVQIGGQTCTLTSMLNITAHKQAQQALNQSLSLMRATLESTADGILLVNTEGKIETFNRVFARMWRLPDDVLATKDDSRALQCVLDQLSEPQKFIEKVHHLYAHPLEESFDSLTFKDGRVFERYSRPQLIDRQVVGRVWSFRDITERRQTEAALRESEASFRALFEQAAVGVTRMETSTGRFLDVNRKYCEITGYSREELLQTNFQAIGHPEELAEDLLSMGRMLAGEIREYSMPRQHVRKDGTLVWLELTVSAMWQPGEPPGHHIAVVQDITARRQTELALRANEERLRAIFETEPECVKLLASDGALLEMNAAGLRMIEADSFAQVANLSVYPLVDAEYRAAFCELNRKVFCGESGVLVFPLTGLKGGRRWMETHAAPLRNEQGRVTAQLSITRDITERRQMEEQFRQSQKMEAIGQLSGGVSHDLNNLLTVIKGHIGLLRAKGQISPEAVDSVQQIDEAADRAANLTRQLLTFSRQQVMQPVVLNLNGVVVNLTRMLRRLLSESIKMEVECVGQSLPIRADEGMVEQVLLNLVVNARDALRKTGTLRITTESVDLDQPAARSLMHARPGAFVCLVVSDTGTGIAPEVLPRIFEPFFTTKGIGKGTGLGLATVYGIMHQHEGWVNVESVVGQGTTFRAYFPRLATAVPETPVDQGSLPMRGGHEGILLVEDESAVRLVAEAALTGLGYRVFPAASGQEALQVWETQRHEIELLLTDMVMPGGITGRDLALRLRASAPRLPVIYMSGYNREMAGGDFALEEGTNFLPKPFELAGLAKVVRASLDRGASNPPFANRSV